MLNQQTIEKLHVMRMRGMADAFTQQQEDPQTTQLSFEERFALLVDRQWSWRQNRALERRLKDARLQGPACIEDIDFRTTRGLDKQVVRSLTQDSDWVRRRQNIFLVGPTGLGKTFLARAFGQKACRDGFTAYFSSAAQLFRELEMARADGSYAKRLRALGQVDVLIVDDWAMAPLTDAEPLALSVLRNGNSLQLGATGLTPGKVYVIRTSTDLKTWTAGTPITAATNTASWPVTGAQSHEFYQVEEKAP